VKTNRKYKDSVFVHYFSDSEKLIELYNAIEGKDYPKDTDLQINTLEGALYLDMLNDVSFLLDGKLIILIEHQSTINENIPLRLLLYIGRIYEKIMDGENIYRQKRIKIPKPEFIVMYNGIEEYPDQSEIKLSDAFEEADVPDMLDLTVKVYNVNHGRNPAILQKSKSLNDYTAFVARVRGNRAGGMTLADAVREAIQYCIGHDIMREFLQKERTEVEICYSRNSIWTSRRGFGVRKAWKKAWKKAWPKAWKKELQKGRPKGKPKPRKMR
jgi:hypothetical protein